MITIWVCDDSKRLAMITAGFIEKELKSRGIKYALEVFFNGRELMDVFVKDNKAPDILFLALKLKKMDGAGLSRLFTENYCRTLIIFMSAFENALKESLRYRPFGCFLKEKMKSEIPYFLDKALLRLSKVRDDCIEFTSKGMHYEVPKGRIKFLMCSNKQLIIYTSDRKFITRATLREMYEQLGKGFFMINRGIVVNLKFIAGVKGKFLTMKGGRVFNCSKSQYREFKKLWLNL